MQNQKNKTVRFIRKNGRIIPIEVDVEVNNHIGRSKNTPKNKGESRAMTYTGLSASALGAGVAADAARTRRIYERGGVTIDRKRFALQPFVPDRFGDKLIMRDKLGKKMATANWYKNVVDGNVVGSFSWLGVKRKYRGQGQSKVISRVAAHEMKKQGMTGIWNQVVHQGSLRTNLTKNDSFWKARNRSDVLTKVPLKTAERNINWYRKTKGLYTSDIFRLTKLHKQKTIMPGIKKAYMTKGMKAKLSVGLAAALGGLALSAYNELK